MIIEPEYKKQIRGIISENLIHSNFKALVNPEDKYRGCLGHKQKHIDNMVEKIWEICKKIEPKSIQNTSNLSKPKESLMENVDSKKYLAKGSKDLLSTNSTSKPKKLILTCCFDCGKKYGTKKNKGAIGVWTATCDICGQVKPCASAPHDFGIYSNEKIRLDDIIQDSI